MAAAVRIATTRARARLDEAMEREQWSAAPAFSSWSGNTAREAALWFDRHQGALRHASSLLQSLDDDLADAAHTAVVEQRRRDDLRLEWERELREEQAASQGGG